MHNILIDLHRGDASALERSYPPASADYACACEYQEELEHEFIATLSQPQLEKFHAYREGWQKLGALDGEQEFIAGYRLGMRMILSAFAHDLASI